MQKGSLIWKIVALVNAALITTAFVGCPARQAPHIVTIAPYGGNISHDPPQDLDPNLKLPNSASKDGKSAP